MLNVHVRETSNIVIIKCTDLFSESAAAGTGPILRWNLFATHTLVTVVFSQLVVRMAARMNSVVVDYVRTYQPMHRSVRRVVFLTIFCEHIVRTTTWRRRRRRRRRKKRTGKKEKELDWYGGKGEDSSPKDSEAACTFLVIFKKIIWRPLHRMFLEKTKALALL